MPSRTSSYDAAMRPWLSIARTFYLCDALLARRFADAGVRTAEHEVLVNLWRDPGISQQTLARRCFNAKSHISALLSSMEQRGWVRRESDPADARARRLFLTAAGERLVARTIAIQSEVAAQMSESVSVKALADVTVAMGRIGDRVQTMLDKRD